MSTNAHAKFSPSGMKRKALCTASHQAEMPYPDVSGARAIDGTHSHTALEYCLKGSEQPIWDAELLIGVTFEDHEGRFKVDKGRADRIQMALGFIKSYVDKGYTVHSELRVDPGAILYRTDWWGTADIILISPDKKHIIVADYKDGSMPVFAEENLQGASYMLGTMAEFNIVDMGIDIDFVIIQPRTGGINHWNTTAGVLMTVILPKLARVISECESSNPTFTPGDEQCQFCKHKENCKARQDLVIKTANIALEAIQLPSGETKALPATLPPIGELSDQQISQILDAAPIVRTWLNDVKNEGQRRVEDGGIIPEFKLVQKSGRRSWIDDIPVIFKTLTNMSANGERVWKKKDLTVETPISFTKVLGNPLLTDAQKRKINEKLLKSPMGKKDLVPVTEKGKDISPAAMLAQVPDNITIAQ